LITRFANGKPAENGFHSAGKKPQTANMSSKNNLALARGRPAMRASLESSPSTTAIAATATAATAATATTATTTVGDDGGSDGGDGDIPVLLALTPSERERFFKERAPEYFEFPQGRKIRWLRWDVTDEESDADGWEKILPRLNPAAIIGAWEMPPLTTGLLARCPALRGFFYLAGSVRAKIPREFIEHGGIVTNWGDEAAPTVAECALMLALMCLRQATRYALEMHVDRAWTSPGKYPRLPRPRSLLRRRVGIHGFGAVARALIRLLAPFGTHIEAFSAPVPDGVYAKHGVTKACDLAALYRDNDVVFIAEALTPETRQCVGAALLSQLRPGAVLVNVARGGLVDEPALAALAARGEVQIGLDVFTVEPLPADSPLRGLRNVSLLPHTAGPTIDWYPQCGRRAMKNLEAWLAGRMPPDAISPRQYDMAT
jgi:phosphoglycerate dehydrogenase-like enzyme